MNVPEELISLARVLGDPSNDLCILAEGNVSCDCGDGTFWVKASGCRLNAIDPEDFVRVESSRLLDALSSSGITREEERALLNRCCVESMDERIPSTEAFFHAALLRSEDINYVAHSHPTHVLALSMIDAGQTACDHRFSPDEAVCCGRASCWIPYVDPGIELARAIVSAGYAFQDRHGEPPIVYVLGNHGLITVGATAKQAESATLMLQKAGRALLLALAAGQTPSALDEAELDAILGWADEVYRQERLWNP